MSIKHDVSGNTPGENDSLDALVVSVPLSPTDTNPPLGPAILARIGQKRGVNIHPFDLNIRYLNRFKRAKASHGGAPIGDQNKNRSVTNAAKLHFMDQCPLKNATPVFPADGVEPELGMNNDFVTISQAVDEASKPGQFWHDFIAEQLFAEFEKAPEVLGLSIMGPPQLFIAMVVAKMASRRWPTTLVVAGGSHITLLRREIAENAAYGEFFHAFMPHHCEQDFAALLHASRRDEDWHDQRGVLIAGAGVRQLESIDMRCEQTFEYDPLFLDEELALYDKNGLTIPLQLTRGCSFGRCAHCTYPKAEPEPSAFTPEHAERAVDVMAGFVQRGMRRFSIKDSLFGPRWMSLLADAIQRRGVRVEWACTTLIDERQPEHLIDATRRASRAGLKTLEFGVETIHHRLQTLIAKVQPIEFVERVVEVCAEEQVHAVLNLIYGLPGERQDEAEFQLAWFQKMEAVHGKAVSGSHNMLEVDLDTPMQKIVEDSLAGRAPWAFNWAWDAPSWRASFALRYRTATHQARRPVILITGPGGAGKTTLANLLASHSGFRRLLSVTTRAPRPGIGTPEYIHVTKEEYHAMTVFGTLIDHYRMANGDAYGLGDFRKREFPEVPVIVTSSDGAGRLRQRLGDDWHPLVVLVDEPDHILKARMQARGDSADAIDRRIKLASHERYPVGGADVILRGGTAEEYTRTLMGLLGVSRASENAA